MTSYEISNYIKLLCIRIDHFESYLVDEKNTDSVEEIEEFVNKYKDLHGTKIVIIQMNNMEIITFDELRKFIRNIHVFDYIRHLIYEGHNVLAVNGNDNVNLEMFLQHMLEDKE